jgi:outer membrane protein assembly factor BamB
MKTVAVTTGVLFLSLVSTRTPEAEPSGDAGRYWPQWRGPLATGASPHGNPPVEWSESKNVRFKVEIPGLGKGTPVIWGERIYLTTAIPTDETASADSVAQPRASGGFRHPAVKPATRVHRYAVLALDRATGKTVWQKTVRRALPHEGTHDYGTFASMSAITDGERVYAFFGSQGLYCFDAEGNLLWEKDLGDMTIRLGFGEGASPVLHGDKLVVSWDHEGQSFLIALDRKTGKTIWKTDRDEITSWATPIVVEHGGVAQVVTSATNRVRSYDLASGELLWHGSGLTLNTVPSPVAAGGMVYVTSGFRGNALLAIKLAAAKGDIADSGAIAWKLDTDTPYVPSPLLYENRLYLLKTNSGILSCLDAKTGERYFRERLPGIENVFASPVAAARRVYVTSREGTTVVIESGPEFKVLASNLLEDAFDASMAVVDREIYLRGRRHLYRIAED